MKNEKKSALHDALHKKLLQIVILMPHHEEEEEHDDEPQDRKLIDQVMKEKEARQGLKRG
jgi:hypothetical protein